LKTVGGTSSQRAYVYSENNEEHRFFFATGSQNWNVDGWSGDAEFVYWGYELKNDRGLLIFCGGTKVSAAGQVLVECARPVPFSEVVWENARAQVLGASDREIRIHDAALRRLTAELVFSASVRKEAGE
jgi:hypothetical protein